MYKNHESDTVFNFLTSREKVRKNREITTVPDLFKAKSNFDFTRKIDKITNT